MKKRLKITLNAPLVLGFATVAVFLLGVFIGSSTKR